VATSTQKIGSTHKNVGKSDFLGPVRMGWAGFEWCAAAAGLIHLPRAPGDEMI